MEATVQELQERVTAMQAALEGNAQSGLFKQPPFSGYQTEDVNEWIAKFNRLARFYGWSNAKKLGALPLLLNGPALAWFQTLPSETTGNFESLTEALTNRYGSQDLQFVIRQELYARKQYENEPLVTYTEDIIKKCQRLNLADIEMMNIFVNGLRADIKNHVLLNQPKTFAEAENLARLRDSVSKSFGQTVSTPSTQEQRIKELEGQVNLLLELTSPRRSNPSSSGPSLNALDPQNTFQSHPANITTQGTHNFIEDRLQNLKFDLIAAMDQRFANNRVQQSRQRFPPPASHRDNASRGRNLRTTDGQPICNVCHRVGHVARYCNVRNYSPVKSADFLRANAGYSLQQSNSQNLNGQGPSYWGN